MEMLILRPALYKDVEAIARLDRELFEFPYSEEEIEKYMGQKSKDFFVLDNGYGLFGSLNLRHTNMWESNVDSICVRHDHQMSGLGRNMINYIVSLSEERNKNVTAGIRMRNDGARNFFERCGFQFEEIKEKWYRKSSEPVYFMKYHNTFQTS